MSVNLKSWQVVLNNWQGSPRRFNNYLKAVRNHNAIEAEQKLRFLISPCCVALRKLIKSGIANASNDTSVNINNLIIKEATAGRGKFLKRVVFRGRGRVGKVTKFSSNVTVVLANKESDGK